MSKIRLMLPAYNEELSLPALLKRIVEVKESENIPLEVVLVNDGSTDNTLQIGKDHGIRCIDLQPNQGLAAAMRAGITAAAEEMEEEDILICMDADDSHHPDLIPSMLQNIKEGADLVIASRYQKGSKVIGLSQFRIFLTRVAGILYGLLAPVRGVRDYTCGYRAYRISLLQKMVHHYGESLIEKDGFACMGEILLKTKRFNPKIKEVPLILRYDRKMSESKMNIVNSIKQTLELIFFTS